MSVAKVVVLGFLLAGSLGSSARGGPMLFLGTYSNQPSPGTFWANVAPSDPGQPGPGPGPLRLGLSDPSSPVPQTLLAAPAPSPSPGPTQVSPEIAPPPASLMAPAPSGSFDAFLNLGNGPYPQAGSMTTGSAQPWFLSQPVDALFGGVPSAQQRADFDNAVLQRVSQTFRQSGVNLSITGDPNAPAAHTISVVSNTVHPTSGQVIGMTYLGGNGFHYIDQSAKPARSVDQLEWIVAHNVAHELMLAFGVPENHDTTGRFIDARNANWGMMIDPAARFSPEAAQDLLSRDFQARPSSSVLMGAQLLETPAVPEPSAVALWILGGSALGIGMRIRSAARGSILSSDISVP